MTAATTFDFFSTSLEGSTLVPHKHSIRVTILAGSPWFVAADVCRALGFTHVETSMSRYVSKLGSDVLLKVGKSQGLASKFPMWCVSESGLYKLIMCSDGQYVITGFSEWLPGWKAKGWRGSNKKPVANAELWRALEVAASRHLTVAWEWVKGHAGHELNERVDRIASGEAQAA